jgi:hypothetical protein
MQGKGVNLGPTRHSPRCRHGCRHKYRRRREAEAAVFKLVYITSYKVLYNLINLGTI